MKKLFIIFLILFSIFLIPPTYAVGDDIEGHEIIYKQSDKVLTINTILSLYTSILGDVVVISDGFTGNGNLPGIYSIVLGVDGESEISKEISISVKQTLGDVILVGDDNELYIYKNVTLIPNDVINILVRTNFIEITSATQITLLSNTYSENANTPGSYQIEFKLENTGGFEGEYIVYLHVSDTESLEPSIIIQPEPTGFQKIIEWFRNITIPWDTLFMGAGAIGLLLIGLALWKWQRKKRRG